MSKLGDFKQRVVQEVRAICDEESLNYQVPTARGDAFEIWCARKLADFERGYDTDADAAVVGGTKDLGIDIVMRSDGDDRTLICQCKFYEGQRAQAKEADIDHFVALANRLQDTEWVMGNAARTVRDALGDPRALYDQPENLTFRFITTASISERVKASFQTQTSDVDGPRFELWGASELRKFVERGESLDQSVPKTVSIDLPKDQWVRVKEPNAGVVAVLKASVIVGLYKEHMESLYAYNIRRNLGRTDINKGMATTLSEEPQSFFYFNNGISAICTDLTIAGNRLTARDFQIINGTQTVHALWERSTAAPQARVLFRLTQGEDVKTERGFNADIIRFNNSQNVVKDSDFRSNDNIQSWLDERLNRRPWPYDAVPMIRYARKRGSLSRGRTGQITIRLEEMAKLRYAWLYEPTTISRPKALFAPKEENGKYDDAFGINGALVDEWPDEVLEEALLAIWFHLEIQKWIKLLKADHQSDSDDQNVNWVTGHRWHFLALAGAVSRTQGWDAAYLLRDHERCQEVFWGSYIERAWELIGAAEMRRAAEQRQGWRDWRQSPTEWERLRREMLAGIRRESSLDKIRDQMRSEGRP